MSSKKETKTEAEEPAEEAYVINYVVNFNNCTIDTVNISQTGKPKDPIDPHT